MYVNSYLNSSGSHYLDCAWRISEERWKGSTRAARLVSAFDVDSTRSKRLRPEPFPKK